MREINKKDCSLYMVCWPIKRRRDRRQERKRKMKSCKLLPPMMIEYLRGGKKKRRGMEKMHTLLRSRQPSKTKQKERENRRCISIQTWVILADIPRSFFPLCSLLALEPLPQPSSSSFPFFFSPCGTAPLHHFLRYSPALSLSSF